MHSGFFEDMLSIPSNDDTEGTESNPMNVPHELCTDQSFTILCKFMYPKRMGYFLNVLAYDIDIWGHVLKATDALQMTDTRTIILDRLQGHEVNTSNAVKFLQICMDYEETPRCLIFKCLTILAYRRQRITPEEVGALGEKGTYLVNYTRERVLLTLALMATGGPLELEGEAKRLLSLGDRRFAILRRVIDNISASDRHARKTDADAPNIFQLCYYPTLCDSCARQEASNQRLFKLVFDKVVMSCVDELIQVPDTLGAHMSLKD
ncbi:unnamed protein product [Rhizoctonia solani]|uniref:BTB domain-containing protein n=1 Tax=Rhizoctonia solani TaxID=456999 RepID=A0A8H3BZF4_9AGAM|nr:unnamed protein product [Rhizoctonia solani]